MSLDVVDAATEYDPGVATRFDCNLDPAGQTSLWADAGYTAVHWAEHTDGRTTCLAYGADALVWEASDGCLAAFF